MTKLMSPGVYISQVPDVGYYYAPYTPIRMMTWKEMLADLHLKKLAYTNMPNREKEDAVLKTVTDLIQEQFPGEYIVEEFFDTNRMTFAFRLKFEDPKQETFFKLKYPS